MPEELPTEPVVETKLMPPAAPAVVVPPPPTCPVCATLVVVYAGANPDKAGTGFCPICGTRRRLKG